jgi:transposase
VPPSVPTNTEVITLGVDTHTRTPPRRLSPGWPGQRPGHSERTCDPGGLRESRELGQRVRSSRACRGGGHRLLRSRASPPFLRAQGIEVFEVIRPKRREQYRSGKSDPIDAQAAARSVLAGTPIGEPKEAEGEVEMIRTLPITRRSAL